MARAVLGDVIEGLLQVIDNPDRKDQIGVLGAPVFRDCRLGDPQSLTRRITAQLDTGLGEDGQSLFKEGCGTRAVQQQGLNGIAGRGILGFGVEGDPKGLGNVNLLIDVQMADPVGMAKDGDAGVVLDKAH